MGQILVDSLKLELLFVTVLVFPLLIQLLLLYGVSRGLWNFSHRQFGRGVWAFFALLGVPIHELSHAIAFLVTGAGVRKMVLFAPKGLPEHNGATGIVIPKRQPSFLSMLVASIAPFFGCSLLAFVFLRLLLPDLVLDLQPVEINVAEASIVQVAAATLASAGQGVIEGLQQLDFLDWRTYLGIYIGASLGLGAAPSREDLKHFLPAVASVLLLLFPVFVLMQTLGNPQQTLITVQQAAEGFFVVLSTALLYATLFAGIGLGVLLVLAALRRMLTR